MEAIAVCDPNVDEEEMPRLSGQSLQILRRLRKGPASNRELAAISHRFGGRIFDLRKHGIKIRTFNRDAVTGLVWYRLA